MPSLLIHFTPYIIHMMSTSLLEKLEPHLSSTTGQSANDAELILRLISESGLYSSDDEQVEGAVDEYINGKPLAYITSTLLPL